MNTKTALPLILCLAFSTPVKPQQPQVGYTAAGIVVICVGGYCIYKIVKVCQKKFPPKDKDTNAPDPNFRAIGSDEYGGAYEFSSIGSCYIPVSVNPYEDLTHNPTTFTLNVLLHYDGSLSTSMSVNNREGTAQTWDQFVADIATHGLFLTGQPTWQPQFERAGVPCDPSAVPISFDGSTGRVIHESSGEPKRITVTRSPNLQDWYPLMTTDVGVGTGFQVVDTTREGQMFYRVTVQ